MNDAHSRNLDLNLLRVMAALLEEGSATRAGARLGLTQSAVSHALSRLRAALGDELFVRGPSGLQATPRAAEMGAAIRTALNMMETAVAAPTFDPQVHERVFRIASGAYTCSVLMPVVVQRLLDEAPGVRLQIQSVDASVAEDLDRGRLDMAIGGFEHVAPRFTHVPLFTDTGVWVVRADHPMLRQPVTPEILARQPQLTIGSAQGAGTGGAAREAGLRQLTTWREDYSLGAASVADADAAVDVPDSYAALAMVSQTDMVTLLPRRLANLALQGGRVGLIEPAGRAEPLSFGAVVRSSESQSGPVAWLLSLIAEVAARL